MKTKRDNNIPLYYFNNFLDQDGVLHYVSSKNGGISTGVFDSLNLSYNVGDNPELVRFNRFKLAGELGVHNDRLIFPRQSHSDNIKVIDYNFLLLDGYKKQKYLENTDALITKEPHIFISVLVADCVPVIFYDKIKAVVAVAHAGWKGSLKRIVAKTASKMKDHYLCGAKNIIVGIGPSIGPENYIISEDVASKFKKEFKDETNKFLTRMKDDTFQLNLWELTKIQLLDEGIAEENIEFSEMCTFEKQKLFYSHRRDQGNTGRFACGIMIK
jgi:YfiH family protein